MTDRLTISFQEDADGVTAQFIEVPAAISCGATREAAKANVIAALALVKEDDRKRTQPKRLC